MKYNMRRLLSLVMALAMLMTAFALAEEVPVEVEGEPGIGGESGIDTAPQGLEDDVAIDLDLGGDIMDLQTEGDLSLDLNSALELSGEELAPVTGAAMNAGEGGTSESDAIEIGTWEALVAAMTNDSGSKRTGEAENNPTFFKLTDDVTYTSGGSAIKVEDNRHIVLDLNGKKIDRALTSATGSRYVMEVSGAGLRAAGPADG